MMPAIAVVVPVFNAGTFLGEAIESVRAQTFTDWELLLVDDGSTDESISIAEEFCDLDSRIRLVRHDPGKNRGAPASRNLGARMSSAKYLANLDHDDVFLDKRKLEDQFSILEEKPNIAMTFGPLTVWNTWSTETLKHDFLQLFSFRVPREIYPPCFLPLLISGKNDPHGYLVRRDAFEGVGGYEEGLLFLDDWPLYMKVSLQYAIYISEKSTYGYRQHALQQTRRAIDAGDYFTQYLPFFDFAETYLESSDNFHRKSLLSAMYAARRKFETWAKFEPILATIENFDEVGYLAQNPDVQAAVAAGQVPSARVHFDVAGSRESRRQRRSMPGHSTSDPHRAAWTVNMIHADRVSPANEGSESRREWPDSRFQHGDLYHEFLKPKLRTRRTEKWHHYFDIYERHFAPYRGKAVTVLEIGIYKGGSLELWRSYFGPQARIVGLDLDPACAAFAEPGIEIFVGDQADRSFLRRVLAKVGPPDIVVDDGGHTMNQQITTFEEIYPVMPVPAVYLVEDTHTSFHGGEYADRFDGQTFLDFAFNRSRALHEWTMTRANFQRLFLPPQERRGDTPAVSEFCRRTGALHFYDSVVVFERQDRQEPWHEER